MSIEKATVFEVDHDTPADVIEQVSELWCDKEYGNDDYYYSWGGKYGAQDFTDYPVIDKYLRDQGVTECLIHYSW